MRIGLLFGAFMLSWLSASSQQKTDSLLSKASQTLDAASQFPNKLFSGINKKLSDLNSSIDRQTEKYLQKLQRKEDKFRRRLARKDSAAAAAFAKGAGGYEKYTKQVTGADSSAKGALTGEYMPYVDSLKGSLSFLQQNQDKLNFSPATQQALSGSMGQFNELQGKIDATQQARNYIAQRKEQMRQMVQKYIDDSGLKKYLDQYKSDCYYLEEQLREYKEALNNPDLLLKKTLALLNKVPEFQRYMQQYGQLAGLFGISPDYGTAAGLEGLQTRAQVEQLMQGQIGSSPAGISAFQNSLEDAHNQLDQLKDKLSSLGQGSGDMEMPDFKPNPEKTHSFFRRLQWGMDLQTTRASYFWPTTTDIGLSVAYKVSGKLDFGIGGSYKIGWGQSINHVKLSSQGASIRTFFDFQLKKSFYASGGYELNYQEAFTSFSQISSVRDWSRSCLIGVTKEITLGGKFLKKTKVQLLFDVLSYYQTPRTNPIKFRIGYTL
ncbi:MAG TPA: hypothetical protein VG890_16535 [Puia sp.]|nr:hypothetical protein [Puia sp.]